MNDLPESRLINGQNNSDVVNHEVRSKTGKKHKKCIFACFIPYVGQPDDHMG